MRKPSVISIVPVELFTEDNFTNVKNGLEERFNSIKEAFNTADETKTNTADETRTSGEDGSNDKQVKEIQKVIKSNFSFTGDDFKIAFLDTSRPAFPEESFPGSDRSDPQVSLEIFLAFNDTSLIFIAIYELEGNFSDDEELFEIMGKIRKQHNDSIENLYSRVGDKYQQNNEKNKVEVNQEKPKDLVSYIKCIKAPCNPKLWDFACPSYAFTFFYLPDSEKNSSSKKMLERARKLADAPKKLATSLEELADTQKGRSQDIEFDDECAVHANWSKLCVAVSGKVAEEKNSYLNDVIALQIVLQMFWNRSDCFSKLAYKIVRDDLDIKKDLEIKDPQKLHLEFLTAITNIEFIASTTVSDKILKLLEPFIKTSRINAINTKLKNHLEMLNYRDRQAQEKVERKYQNSIQTILIVLPALAIATTVFDLGWIDLDSWQLLIALIILAVIFVSMVVWVFMSSKSVKKIIQKL